MMVLSSVTGDELATLARLRLDVAYDGTDFSGWAVQPDRRTVAGVLASALAALFQSEPPRLTVAGRTDAGVHATGQVCHLDVSAARWSALADTFVRRLSGLLPGDVRVLKVQQVPVEFDARFSARYRRYEYRVTDAEFGALPSRRRDTLAWPRPLDLDVVAQSAVGLRGEHDFVAFCRRKDHATTIREITRFDWRRDPDGILVATVQADAFCQAMVRSLIGAMLAVGDGRRPPTWPASLLDRTQRASEVMVAPPTGLTLVAVGYPDDGAAGYAARAATTRAVRRPIS